MLDFKLVISLVIKVDTLCPQSWLFYLGPIPSGFLCFIYISFDFYQFHRFSCFFYLASTYLECSCYDATDVKSTIMNQTLPENISWTHKLPGWLWLYCFALKTNNKHIKLAKAQKYVFAFLKRNYTVSEHNKPKTLFI